MFWTLELNLGNVVVVIVIVVDAVLIVFVAARQVQSQGDYVCVFQHWLKSENITTCTGTCYIIRSSSSKQSYKLTMLIVCSELSHKTPCSMCYSWAPSSSPPESSSCQPCTPCSQSYSLSVYKQISVGLLEEST